MNVISRRSFIGGVGVSGVGVILGGCARKGASKEVTAVEDLMREHGVLRRALLVYEETAPKLRENPTPALADALQKTATLFRTFGEDYHEKKLEEGYIFPELKRADPAQSALLDTLIAQHERGRQITDYILALTKGATFAEGRAPEAAGVLGSFVLMYQNHAAREDTIIFPAWKKILPAEELEEMGEKFEDIEHEQFGEDGFEDAVHRIAGIENSLGLGNIVQFTPPPPPRSTQ
jgi:hemerythrin-like domain-containing protein